MNLSIQTGKEVLGFNKSGLNGHQSAAIQRLRSAYSLEGSPVVPAVATIGINGNEVATNKVILIVDENANDSELINEFLVSAEEGYKIVVTDNFTSACDVAATIMPHLIIADWHTLRRQGLDWIALLKTNPNMENIPAILLTDRAASFGKTSFPLEQEIVDCILKPIDKLELKTRVRLLLRLHDQLSALRHHNLAIQKELELKHRELFLHLELLMYSGSVKDKMLEGIHKLQPYLSSEGKSKLSTLMKQFRWELNDEATVNFARAFDDLNASLYSRLGKICPQITKGEKRLCAFVIKDHSSSDIARITKKSQNSINVAFSRLRSKLKLSNSKSLRAFLETVSAEPKAEGFSFTRAIMSVPLSGTSFHAGFDTLQSA